MSTTSRRLRKQLVRATAVTGLTVAVAAAGSVAPAAAYASTVPLGKYTVAIPMADRFIQIGQAHTIDLTYTNVSGITNYLLERATATLTGFTVTSASASGGWTATVSSTGSTVTINPPAVVGLLDEQSVTMSIVAQAPATLSAGVKTISTTASGLVGITGVLTDFDRVGADPTLEVAPYAATDSCEGNEDCDTGRVGDLNGTSAQATSGADGSEDTVGVAVGGPEGRCGNGMKVDGKSEPVTVDSVSPTRTVTVSIWVDKAAVGGAPQGVGQIGVCHDSPKPFTDANGATVNVGMLPDCGSGPAALPCLVKCTKTGAGDFYCVIKQQGGDPKNVMGYPIPGGGFDDPVTA